MKKGKHMDASAAIRATVGPWTKASLDRNWDGLLALCTTDVVFSPPGEPAVSGAKLRPWLDAFPIMKQFTFDFERIEVSGDLATGTGRGTFTFEINGRDTPLPFKFADIFRKSKDGTWLCAHVMWNLDVPMS